MDSQLAAKDVSASSTFCFGVSFWVLALVA